MLIVLIGEACSGKTTLENKLVEELGITRVDVFTTREKRPSDGDHYYYLSSDLTFLEVTNLFTFWFKSNEGTYYGYKIKDDYKVKNYIISFISYEDYDLHIKPKLDTKYTTKVHLKAEEEDLVKCFKERGYTKDQIEKRRSVYVKDPKDKDIIIVNRYNGFEKIKEIIDNINYPQIKFS